MNRTTQLARLIRKAEILKSICVEEGGCCASHEEPVDPGEDCICAILISRGYPGSAISIVDAKDGESMNYLRNLIYGAVEVRGGPTQSV